MYSVIPYRCFGTACRRFQDVILFLNPRHVVLSHAVTQSFDVVPSSRRADRIWCSDRLTAREILVRAVELSPLCNTALHPCLLYLPLKVYNFGSCQRF